MVKRIGHFARRHFEVGLYVWFWIGAAVLAAWVGRPWLGAIGGITVAPFVIAYVWAGQKTRSDLQR